MSHSPSTFFTNQSYFPPCRVMKLLLPPPGGLKDQLRARLVAAAEGHRLHPASPALTHQTQAIIFAGQSGARTHTAPARHSRAGVGFSAQAVVRAGLERAHRVARRQNTFHPFMLWKTVTPARRSEVVSSTKTQLSFF